MSHNVLIGSTVNSFGQSLLENFSQNATFRIAYETDMDQVVKKIKEEHIKICILNFDDITPVELDLCRQIVEISGQTPVLILGQSNEFTEALMEKHERVHFLQKPLDETQIRLFSSKLLLAKTLPVQKHKRFTTDQEAKIELVENGNYYFACVKNLSMGGAYCVFNNNDKLPIGSLIRLNVENKESEKKVMNAKVVWTNTHSIENGQFSFGLKFLKQDEIVSE